MVIFFLLNCNLYANTALMLSWAARVSRCEQQTFTASHTSRSPLFTLSLSVFTPSSSPPPYLIWYVPVFLRGADCQTHYLRCLQRPVGAGVLVTLVVAEAAVVQCAPATAELWHTEKHPLKLFENPLSITVWLTLLMRSCLMSILYSTVFVRVGFL